MTDSNTFTCEACGRTYPKAWTDEEAKAEANNIFGPIADPAIICDDCWNELWELTP